MVFDIAKMILEVGKTLFGFRADLAKADRERRDRVADYFSDIAKLIEKVSEILKTNQYPHGACMQLEKLANLMPETLKGLLKPEEIEENKKNLLSVHEVERLYNELQTLSPSESAAKLAQLDEAAGQFHALAMHLRVAV